MSKRKLLMMTLVVVAAGMLPRAAALQTEVESGSNRKVITCNSDGSYTCANEQCIPGYCCQIGG